MVREGRGEREREGGVGGGGVQTDRQRDVTVDTSHTFGQRRTRNVPCELWVARSDQVHRLHGSQRHNRMVLCIASKWVC